MAEKILNSRIQLKHDTEVNWGKAENFIPKIGEVILYDVDSNHDCVRIKIGDGVTPINNLPFAVDYNETIADIKIEGATLSYTKGNGTTNSYDIYGAAITNDEIDAICGAIIYSSGEVEL